MAHIYQQFDFGGDEEKAQLARHKLETWKQAFRLDKKLLYKFERSGEGAASEEAKPAKAEAAKGKSKAKDEKPKSAPGKVLLLVRLGFSSHEKITEHRWVERIPSEEPFVTASPVTVKTDDARFGEIEKRFEELE
jgi:hypothetical protein